MDRVSAAERSRIMAAVRGKDTAPERVVRRLLHRLGYRFRLHRADLPGRPDIVLPGRRTVVFVHGCFWHRHPGCRRATTPATRREYWLAKFRRNRARDRKVQRLLEADGWKVLVVWECETADLHALAATLKRSLGRRRARARSNSSPASAASASPPTPAD